MNFRPLNDRIVVKRLEAQDKVGSLFVPAASQQKPNRGVVIAAGRGHVTENGTFVETTVKERDVVLFAKHAGTEVQFDGETYLILREQDIYGIIEILDEEE